MCELLKLLLRMEDHFLVICFPDCHSIPQVSGIRHRCAGAGMGLGLGGKGLGLGQAAAHLWYKKKYKLGTWVVQGKSKIWNTFDS